MRYYSRAIMLWLLVSATVVAYGQETTVFTVHFQEIFLADAIAELSDISGVNIVFSPDQVDKVPVNVKASGTTEQILSQLIAGSNVRYKSRNGYYLLYKPRAAAAQYIVSGYVEDETNSEMLAGAHVYSEKHGVGTSTNEFGHFSLALPEPGAYLKFSYLGFISDTAYVERSEESAHIKLKRSVTLKEVVITSEENERITTRKLNTEHIVPDQINPSTGLGGQFDLNQHVVQSAGVTTGADGIGGLNIRGGSNDQNLVLMDGVPVYNPTHAIGIISVFNPTTIREVNFSKGGYGAKYAGRLSSVMDVRTKDGNKNKWGFTAGISPLSAHMFVDGPLVKDKVSILIGGRGFIPGGYLHNMSIREKEKNGIDGFTRYSFNDINVKLSAEVTSRDKVHFGFYRGRDGYKDHTEQRKILEKSRLLEEFDKKLEWGNTIGSLSWSHEFGTKLFSNVTVNASRFGLQSLDVISFTQTLFDPRVDVKGFVSHEFKTTIEDVGFRWDLDQLVGPRHRLKYGVSVVHHYFKPKSIAFDDQAQIGSFVFDEQTIDDALFTDLYVKAWESGVYLEDEFTVSDKVSLDLGVHVSMFADGETTFIHPQPRIAVEYKPVPTLALGLSGSRMVQYLHLLTSSGFGLPTDLWVPASDKVRPQEATQFGAGAVWQVAPRIEIGVQGYYKDMTNLVEFSEGASFLLEEGAVEASIVDAGNWEEKVAQGRGTSVGLEGHFAIRYPKWQVEANYTLSKSDRQFDDLNFGKEFAFRYDRRHSVALSGSYQINEVFAANANWTYGSGTPITLAQSKFLFPGSVASLPAVGVLEFGERNGYRLPAYHRLDVGISATIKKERFEHMFNLSLYNLYGRRNLLYVTLIPAEDSEDFTSSQFTVLPFIPSISYQIRL